MTLALVLAAGGPVAAQSSGADIYRKHCQSCHGSAEAAGSVAPLTAANLYRPFGARPVSPEELAKWIRLNMPPNDSGVLSSADALAVTQQVLAAAQAGFPAKPMGKGERR